MPREQKERTVGKMQGGTVGRENSGQNAGKINAGAQQKVINK